MLWIIAIVYVVCIEHILNPFLSERGVWELALMAKYMTMAFVLQALLAETKGRALFYRSLVALFCIAAWIDLAGQVMWQMWGFDSSWPIFIGFSAWFIHTAKRSYYVQGDKVQGRNIFILFHRPQTTYAVIKALVGRPADSVSICACGQAWSFTRSGGRFALYPGGAIVLSMNIAVDTGIELSPEIEEMLDDIVGQPRFPGTKCVWAIRHVLKKLGPGYAPRWCDYIPGIYAMRLLNGAAK